MVLPVTTRRTRKVSQVQWLSALTGVSPYTSWRDSTGHPWEITAHWAVVDGRATMVGLDIRSFRDAGSERRQLQDGLGEVTQRVVRGLPLSQVREVTRAALVQHAQLMTAHFTAPEDADEAATFAEQTQVLTTKGEPRKRLPAATAALLEQVARLYLAAIAGGHKTPARVVEAQLREAGIPVSEQGGRDQVRKWIQRARERGLIPPVGETK